MSIIQRQEIIEVQYAGERLDKVLAQIFPEYSRACLQRWLKSGEITVDGALLRGRERVQGGECVSIDARLAEQTLSKPDDIPLDIISEDEHLLVINKPAGLVVHPGAGHQRKTLMNALLHYLPEQQALPRAGIVHRLDKETSGLLVVAKTPIAHTALIRQLQERTMKREYQAIVCGVMIAGGTIDAPVGRHPHHRTRMAIEPLHGKPAVTHYRVLERFRVHTRLKLSLESGRTHQIRVHMAHAHYPLLGDPVYGQRLQIPKHADDALIDVLRSFKRQALHAWQLSVVHPITEAELTWQVPLPSDIEHLLDVLRNDAQMHKQEHRQR